MSRSVVYTPAAENDLYEIGEWIGVPAGLQTALAYVRRIRARCANLADFPSLGSPKEDYGLDVRSLAHKPYLILYRADDSVVTILRVIHGSRDIRSVRLDRATAASPPPGSRSPPRRCRAPRS